MSPAQQEARDRFSEAAAYGKMALSDAAVRARYLARARDKGTPVFSLTVADFFRAPTVHEIDLDGYTGQPGGRIMVRATDGFEVRGVAVQAADAAGTALEAGAAVETAANSGIWVYQAQTAQDLPGNQATLESGKRL